MIEKLATEGLRIAESIRPMATVDADPIETATDAALGEIEEKFRQIRKLAQDEQRYFECSDPLRGDYLRAVNFDR